MDISFEGLKCIISEPNTYFYSNSLFNCAFGTDITNKQQKLSLKQNELHKHSSTMDIVCFFFVFSHFTFFRPCYSQAWMCLLCYLFFYMFLCFINPGFQFETQWCCGQKRCYQFINNSFANNIVCNYRPSGRVVNIGNCLWTLLIWVSYESLSTSH